MATAHVYVRVQVRASEADVTLIAEAAEALHQAVVSAGGEWIGNVSVTGEAVESVSPPPPGVSAVEEAHEDSVSADEPVGDTGVPLSSRASHRGRATVAASGKPARRKVR